MGSNSKLSWRGNLQLLLFRCRYGITLLFTHTAPFSLIKKKRLQFGSLQSVHRRGDWMPDVGMALTFHYAGDSFSDVQILNGRTWLWTPRGQAVYSLWSDILRSFRWFYGMDFTQKTPTCLLNSGKRSLKLYRSLLFRSPLNSSLYECLLG